MYDKALRQRGFLCNYQVYQAALHGMQVGHCLCFKGIQIWHPDQQQRRLLQVTRGMHKLRLPGSSLGAASTAMCAGPALAVSSADHLLGVQPQELLAVQMPELKRTQVRSQSPVPIA